MMTPAVSKYTCAVSPLEDIPAMPPIESEVSSAAFKKNNATVDHAHAASVPIETSVSMVAVRCRRLTKAALWNAQPQ